MLEARVKAANRANSIANQIHPLLTAVFAPFVGQKIEKADGSLLAKVQKLVDALDLPNVDTVRIVRNSSNYSLSYKVTTCETDNGRAHYFDQTVYVAEMSNGVLTKLCTLNKPFKEDYNAHDVMMAREAYQKAKRAADQAFDRLYPFGEYDR